MRYRDAIGEGKEVLSMTVLVTGASRGIGRAVAEAFAREGYHVAMCATENGVLPDAAAALAARFGADTIAAFAADVSDYAAAERVWKDATARFGGIDVLVNNAGVAAYGLFADMQPEAWRRVTDVNINAMLNLSHHAARDMARAHAGCIVNISSIWGEAGASCEAVYAMTKGAVNAFTKSLGKELGPSGVRVNAIACGMIDTDMNARLTDEERRAFTDEVPLMRMGTAAEVAEVALFLAGERAGYVNAQVWTVDGGYR